MTRIHQDNPAEAVENAYFRIFRERLADVPTHNLALSVEAVDFQKWQGQWLGMLVTPWCMSVVLVPGQEEGWESTGDNQRRFVKFPAGHFAFLGGSEPDLIEYQTCALFSGMGQFANQALAVQAARAALSAMMQAPDAGEAANPAEQVEKPKDGPSLSRRRLFGLRERS